MFILSEKSVPEQRIRGSSSHPVQKTTLQLKPGLLLPTISVHFANLVALKSLQLEKLHTNMNSLIRRAPGCLNGHGKEGGYCCFTGLVVHGTIREKQIGANIFRPEGL